MDEITLREFTFEDIAQTFKWVQNKELQRLFTMREEPTWETHKEYFKKLMADPTQKIYAICTDDRHIGNCGLKNIKDKEAELWLYIGDKTQRGKGYGSSVCKKLLSESIKKKLALIYLHVLASNLQAIRVYDKLGFVEVRMDAEDEKQWKSRGLNIIKMEKVLNNE